MIKRFLFIITVFIFVCASVSSQNKLATELCDSSQIVSKIPSAEEITAYKSLPEYNYVQFKESESLWDKFVRWIGNALKDIGVTPNGMKYALIVVACGIVLFFVLRLLGIKPSGIFVFKYDREVTQLKFQQAEDDIYAEDLEKTLQTYIRNGAYREAVRIMYLFCIRTMDESAWIEWKPWKTNKDYYYELIKNNAHNTFKHLMMSYEYVWYGQFAIDKELFEKIQDEFNAFGNGVKNSANQVMKNS